MKLKVQLIAGEHTSKYASAYYSDSEAEMS